MVMIVGVFSFVLVIVSGQDVAFLYEEQCYNVGDSVTMTAVYSGTGNVTIVQWYYSNQTAANLFIKAVDCLVFGSVPPGYPNPSRMSYKCPATDFLPANTFKLILSKLKDDELKESWGATFSLSASLPPDVVNSSITECITTPETITTEETTTTTTTTTSTSTSPPTPPSTRPPPPPSPDDNSDIIGIAVGVGVAVLLVLSVIVCLYCRHKKMKHKQEKTNRSETLSDRQMHNHPRDKAVFSENRL